MKFKIFEEKELKGDFESEEKFWEALKAGFEVEKEHAESVDNCPITTAKIALDHLGESISYYDKLKKMETEDKPKEDEPKEEEKKEEDKEEKDEDDKEEEKKDDSKPSMKV